jgi:murein DD-endopeptidase MepM/ murein hydrolase activator NlpD
VTPYTYAYPVKPWRRYTVWPGTRFLDPAYLQSIGRHHQGIDLNYLSGGDSDLGAPVQAMFPGVVVAADDYGSWGGIVLIESDEWVVKDIGRSIGTHLQRLDVQYAHLMQITVGVGERVAPGDHLGSIGKGGNNQYSAHLHLEMRRTRLAPNHPQGSGDIARKFVEEHFIDPQRVMSAASFADTSTVMPRRQMVSQPVDFYGLEGAQFQLSNERRFVANVVGSKFFLRSEEGVTDVK